MNVSVLDVEAANLRKNIASDEVALRSMYDEFFRLKLPCCHKCAFGDVYRKVYDRLRRRIDRLDQIRAKLSRARHPYSPLPPPTFSWEL